MPCVLCISFCPTSFIHRSIFTIQESVVIRNSKISYKNKLIPSLNLNFIKNIHNIHPHKSEVIITGQEKCPEFSQPRRQLPQTVYIIQNYKSISIPRWMVSNKTLCTRLNLDPQHHHYMITNEAPSMSLALFN